MLPLATSSWTSNYGDELRALPAQESGSIFSSPREACNDYDAVNTLRQGEGRFWTDTEAEA